MYLLTYVALIVACSLTTILAVAFAYTQYKRFVDLAIRLHHSAQAAGIAQDSVRAQLLIEHKLDIALARRVTALESALYADYHTIAPVQADVTHTTPKGF